MRYFITDIIVKVLIGLMVIYIVPQIKKLIENAKQNENLKGLIIIAETVVTSVEQKFWDKDGTFKKDLATKEFIEMAKKHGYNFNSIDVENYLESAVKAMNEYKNIQ